MASHEATDTLHRAIWLAPYLPSGMVVAIAVESVTLYYIVVVELNLLQGYFMDLIKTLTPPPARPLWKRLCTSDRADP